jgi:hypothetical protein
MTNEPEKNGILPDYIEMEKDKNKSEEKPKINNEAKPEDN